MTTYNIVRHYYDTRLVGIWVEQDIGPPTNAYIGVDSAVVDDARTVVLQKPEGMSWHEQLDNVADGEPWTKHWYAGAAIDAVSSPDAKITLSLMQAEDERLRAR